MTTLYISGSYIFPVQGQYGRYGFGRSTFQEPKLSWGEALVDVTRTHGNNYTVQRYGQLLTCHRCQCGWFAIFPSPPFRNFLFSEEKLRENKGCLAFISTCSDNCIWQLKPNCCMYMFWVLWKNYMAWPLKYSLLWACCISVLSSFFINFTPSSSRCSDCYDLFFFTWFSAHFTTDELIPRLAWTVNCIYCPWMPLNSEPSLQYNSE